jgi:hypothetical protein
VHIPVPITFPSDVKIQIFTIAMREVKVETFPQVQVGQDVTVLLIDKAARTLANGLYYFVIEADGQRWTVKVLVLN